MHIASSIHPRSLHQKTPCVLLLQSQWDDRVYRGVARIASQHRWTLHAPQRWFHDLRLLREKETDGIIVQIGNASNHEEFLRFVKKTSVPVVDLQGDNMLGTAPRIFISHRAVACLAVDHMASRGFKRLCFVGWHGSPAELQLSQSVLESAQEAGCTCEVVHLDGLSQVLEKSRRPLALVAANDLIASTAIHICSIQGFEVPKDIIVLGIGDDDLLCTAGPVGISSVDCNFEAQGEAAGRLMNRLLRGEVIQDGSATIEPGGVMERLSTDSIAVADKKAAEVLRYLRDNYTRQLEIEDLTKLCGLPGGRTWNSFRKQVGRTITQELMRLRIRRAQVLLADENLKPADIAQQCGFISRYRFERAFIRLTGSTPRSYRQKLLFPDGGNLLVSPIHSAAKTVQNPWAC